MPFLSPLVVEVIPDGLYKLTEPFAYRWRAGVITIPKGFVTDFASIPRVARTLITGHDNTRKAAVIHDYLYQHGVGRRAQADLIFREAMQEAGVPRWKRQLAYLAVRIFAGHTWGDNET